MVVVMYSQLMVIVVLTAHLLACITMLLQALIIHAVSIILNTTYMYIHISTNIYKVHIFELM